MQGYTVTNRGGVEDTRLEAKAKDTKKFRGQGQGQTLSRPRTKDTDASVFSKKKKKVFKNFFRRSQKKDLQNFFQAKKVLKNFFSGDLYLRKPEKRSLQIFREVSGGFQRNFNSSRIVLSLSRGQGNFRGLEAWRPRTSKCVLEAKDVLEDSTSGNEVADDRPNQDLNQKCMVLNLLLQFRMPVVLARLRTGPQIEGNVCGINGKTA